MKRLVIGILAHVDSGKTTLSEGMLYRAGSIRRLGRVDHRDAFLDTDSLERARGITIFSKQAVLTLPAAQSLSDPANPYQEDEETELTLLDTPGHVDFSAEAERTLQVLDYAILVISGTDGVQSHTATLWELLKRYRVPTLIFVNKCDLAGAEPAMRLRELRGRFGDGCVDFSRNAPDAESLAMASEPLMQAFLAAGTIETEDIRTAIARRQVFPCWFGAALKLEGVDEFLTGLQHWTRTPAHTAAFGAQVFKISADEQGTRLTHLKITGGALRVKEVLQIPPETAAGEPFAEKADQLRLYSGSKFRLVNEALPGSVVAVAGPQHTRPGQGLGVQADARLPILEPVLNYRLELPQGSSTADLQTALRALRTLAGEDPQLHVVWNEALAEVHLQLMGEIQLEVLQSVLQSRFGITAGFGQGSILYKETLTAPVEGVGHFEPLRHYAEVHLLLEPAPRGSGIQLAAACKPDTLAENWQRLVLAHLAERSHIGVLTGNPLTDVKITLTAGRAHIKHTEGGDFRQATYRAVRQGLRSAAAAGHAALLEPWYKFALTIPQEQVGRAMADLQRMCAVFAPPETQGETAVLSGRAPVATMRGYAQSVAAYTRGAGALACVPNGYAPCHNAEEVIAAAAYNADADTENTADSVFCSHGAGQLVPWNEVPARAHVSSGLTRGFLTGQATESEAAETVQDEAAETAARASAARRRAALYRGTLEQDKELLAIFERTYGPVRRRGENPNLPNYKNGQNSQNGTAAHAAFRSAGQPAPQKSQDLQNRPTTPQNPIPTGPEYLLVDGYNVIFAWDALKAIAADNLEGARRRLTDILCNYAAYRQCVPILVFDAYKVRGNKGEVEQYHNVSIVYTREAETADMYIEKATHTLAKKYRTRVVSSDGAEQMIILGNGALRISSAAFEKEVAAVEAEIREFLQK